MQTLHRPTRRTATSNDAEAEGWVLDVAGFHHEFEALFGALETAAGPAPLRERATELWSTDAPATRDFAARVETDTPEEWATAFDPAHLGQWYVLLMAAHVERTSALRAPDVVRSRLPAIGFSPAYARRLAQGRELSELAGAHAAPAVGAAIDLVLGPGHRGWLSCDDVSFGLERLQQVDRRSFRHAQDLVPLCEDLWHVLSSASLDESSALILLPRRR